LKKDKNFATHCGLENLEKELQAPSFLKMKSKVLDLGEKQLNQRFKEQKEVSQ